MACTLLSIKSLSYIFHACVVLALAATSYQRGFGVILRISTIFGFGRSFLFLCFCFRVAETSGIYLFYVCGVDIGNLTAKICRGSRCLDTGN